MMKKTEENALTGARVKELREKKRMSQGDLAEALGYKAKSAITKIENGVQKIPYRKLQKFAEVLGTSTEYLTGETDDPDYIKFVTTSSVDDGHYYDFLKKSVDDPFPDNNELRDTIKTLQRYARDLSPNDLDDIRSYIIRKAGKQ